jgi:ABC-2 type transport system ATP-binding protein
VYVVNPAAEERRPQITRSAVVDLSLAPDTAPVIEVANLSKRFGDKLAVDGLSFAVRPGLVTGFLGPNGAGKSTTMRLIAGLDAPTSGTALVNGKRYIEHVAPLREVGLLLEAKAVHTSRTARNHLRALAATHGIGTRRVDDVIELTGLRDVAERRAGGFSLGMGQRLGIASALLGDPRTLILDEPVNGLDPEGARWVRGLLRELAAERRTVFLSSHLMSEIALTADHLIVIGRGRLIADISVEEMTSRASRDVVLVRTPDAGRFRELLANPDITVRAAFVRSLTSAGQRPRSPRLSSTTSSTWTPGSSLKSS